MNLTVVTENEGSFTIMIDHLTTWLWEGRVPLVVPLKWPWPMANNGGLTRLQRDVSSTHMLSFCCLDAQRTANSSCYGYHGFILFIYSSELMAERMGEFIGEFMGEYQSFYSGEWMIQIIDSPNHPLMIQIYNGELMGSTIPPNHPNYGWRMVDYWWINGWLVVVTVVDGF